MTDVYLWVNCCIKHTETYTTDIQLFHSARFHLLGQIKQASTMSRTVVLPLTRIAFVLHTIDAPSLSCSGEKIWEDFFKGVLRLLVHDRLHMLLPANWCKDVSGHAETYIHPSKVSKRLGFRDPWLQWLIQITSHTPILPFHNTSPTPLSSDSLWFAVDAQSSPVLHSFLEQPESRSPSQPRQATGPRVTLSGMHKIFSNL